MLSPDSKILTTYDFYDGSIFYSFINPDGKRGIAIWIDEDPTEADEYTRWMVVEMSLDRLVQAEEGAIQNRDLFLQAESGHVFIVDIHRGGVYTLFNTLACGEITDDQLSEPGCYL